MFGWKTYKTPVDTDLAVFSRGDATVPRTHWWNHWYLLLTDAWKRVIVVEVDPSYGDAYAIYSVGYDPEKGSAMCRPINRMTTKAAFRVGYEPCYFFALNSEGKQIPLRIVTELMPAVMLEPGATIV